MTIGDAAISPTDTRQLIRAALREDAAFRDATSRAVIPAQARVRARIIAKAPGILAGGPAAARTFRTLDPSLRVVVSRRDGARLTKGRTVMTVTGRARSIFAAERTALNLLGHLSGVATLTHAYVRKTRSTRTKILDTRKTLPGLRRLEKEAVRVGGGHNHRKDLSEAILIKTNHLRLLEKNRRRGRGPGTRDQWPVTSGQHIREAVRNAKRIRPRRAVEIEVTNFREFNVALNAKPDVVLLDNWSLRAIRRAVRVRRHRTPATGHPLLEVSGRVTLANVRAIARTGVDRISIGRLTHSAPALDLSLTIT